MTKSKFNAIVGSIGAFIGIFVFISYIPQIIADFGNEDKLEIQFEKIEDEYRIKEIIL